jgi:hypothetical protein
MASASIPENAQDASLERLGIHVQTVVPNNVMTSKEVSKVKFTKSRPIGYLIDNVDGFKDIAKETLEWYEQAILGRDQDVLRLGGELDRVEVELLRARQEMAVAAANAPFQEAIQSAKDDPEIEAIMRKAADAERKTERTEKRLAAAVEESAGRKKRVEELEAQLAAALAGGTAAETPVEEHAPAEVLAENESLRVQLAEAETRAQVAEEAVAALNKYTEEQDEYIDALEAQLPPTPEEAEQIEAAEEYTSEDQGGFDLDHYDGVSEALADESFELASAPAEEYEEQAALLGSFESAHTPQEVEAEFELVGGLDDEAALQLLDGPEAAADESEAQAPDVADDAVEFDENGNPIEYDEDGERIYFWDGMRLPKGLTPDALMPQPLPGDETGTNAEGR